MSQNVHFIWETQTKPRAHALKRLLGLSQYVSVFKSGRLSWTLVSAEIFNVPDHHAGESDPRAPTCEKVFCCGERDWVTGFQPFNCDGCSAEHGAAVPHEVLFVHLCLFVHNSWADPSQNMDFGKLMLETESRRESSEEKNVLTY